MYYIVANRSIFINSLRAETHSSVFFICYYTVLSVGSYIFIFDSHLLQYSPREKFQSQIWIVNETKTPGWGLVFPTREKIFSLVNGEEEASFSNASSRVPFRLCIPKGEGVNLLKRKINSR